MPMRSIRRLLAALLLLSLALARQAPARAAGQGGTIYLPLARGGTGAPSPKVAPRFDTGRAARAAIGPEGGTLSAASADGTQYTLTIPPDALDFSETITMTPALAVDGLPLSGGPVGAVNIEPAGVALYTPATLTIASQKAAPAGMIPVGATFAADGAGFHLIPLGRAAQAAALQTARVVITVSTPVIRPISLAYAARGDVQGLLDALPPLTPAEQFEAIAAELEALGLQEQMVSRLGTFDNEVLLPHLERAVTDRAMLDQAIHEYDGWMYVIATNGYAGRLAPLIDRTKARLEQAIGTNAASSALRCSDQHKPEEGFALLRWGRWARKLLPGSPIIARIQSEMRKCLTFRVSMRTQLSEIESVVWGWQYTLHSEFLLQAGTRMRATGSGPLVYDAVDWLGSIFGCSLSGQGAGSTFDALSGQGGLWIAPVSRTSPSVNLKFVYQTGTPVETKGIVCPKGSNSGTTSDWARYYAQLHSDEQRNGVFTATATVTGLGSFPGWVYHHTGAGSQGRLTEDTEIRITHEPQP